MMAANRCLADYLRTEPRRYGAVGVMAALALTAWVPGPDDPVCEPGQVVEVDHCSQGMLPEERIGRQIDPVEPPAPVVDPAALPVATVLAETGTSLEGWVLAGVLVVSGVGMVRVARRGREV